MKKKLEKNEELVSDKASDVLCTDVSEKMLNIAKRKISKRGIANITIDNRSIYALAEPDKSRDVVIASQVLHLLDNPEKAAEELRRIAKSMVILPIAFTKNLKGSAKLSVRFYKMLGFSPKKEFDAEDYKAFLPTIGFDNCKHIQIAGRIPIAVAVWKV